MEHGAKARVVRKHLHERNDEALLDELTPLLPGTPGSVTQKNVQSGLRLYLGWLAERGLSVLDYARVTEFKGWLELHYTPATAKNRLSQVRRLYEALIQVEVADRNPFAQVAGPLNRPHEHRDAYTAEEVERLLAQADTQERALVLLGAVAGLSGGEVCGLAFEQVDLAGGRLVLANRTIPLEAEARRALEAWGRERGNTVLFPRLGPVFDLDNDSQLRRQIFLLCGRANVPYRAWYALRNRAGLRLLENQADPKTAERLLGLNGREALRPLVKMVGLPDRRRKRKPRPEDLTDSTASTTHATKTKKTNI